MNEYQFRLACPICSGRTVWDYLANVPHYRCLKCQAVSFP